MNAIDGLKWQIRHRSTWLKTLFASTAFTMVLAIGFPNRVFSSPISPGRLASLLCCTVLCSTAAILVVSATSDWRSDLFLRRLLRLKVVKILLGMSAILISAILLSGLIELAFYVVNSQKPAGPAKVYEGDYIGAGKFFDVDPDLGTRLLPEKDVACRLKIGDQQIWDVRYRTDEFGRRVTVENGAARRYAIFFGCSYLFGEGASDDETIPSEFTKAAPDYQAYNYGVPGFGTQQMLATLESGRIPSEVPQSSGIVFYLYLPETHESRVIGEMQVFNTFASKFPYYELDASGDLFRGGNLTTGRPFVSRAYSLLSASQAVKHYGLNFPKRTKHHYQLTAKIIEQSRDLCKRQLDCDEFYVVVYPRPIDIKILPYLNEAGIKCLDYSTLFDPLAVGMSHPIDEHPSPEANRVLAQQLVIDTHSEIKN